MSIFSPGKIICIDAENGEPMWSKRLSHYGSEAVVPHGDAVFASSSRTLYKLNAKSGKEMWKYEPYGNAGESLYALPSVSHGRVVVGDRRSGYLHCLDTETGRSIWRSRLPGLQYNAITSTALIDEDLVIVGVGTRYVAAFELDSGRTVWRTDVGDNVTAEVQLYLGMALVWTLRTMFALDVQTGRKVHEWRFGRRELRTVAVADNLIIAVATNYFGVRTVPKSGQPKRIREILISVDGSGWKTLLPYPQWNRASIFYSAKTAMVYEATSRGLGILEPSSGRRIGVIHDFGREDWDWTVNVSSHPAVTEDRIFALSDRGMLWALRHPSEDQARGL